MTNDTPAPHSTVDSEGDPQTKPDPDSALWQLDRWEAGTLTARTCLPRRDAVAALAFYVRASWRKAAAFDRTLPVEPPARDWQAIELFYAVMGKLDEQAEHYDLEPMRFEHHSTTHEVRLGGAALRRLDRDPATERTPVYVLDTLGVSVSVKETPDGQLEIGIDAQDHPGGPVRVSALRGAPEQHHVFYAADEVVDDLYGFIGIKHIADRFGVAMTTVCSWRTRYATWSLPFPEPDKSGYAPQWRGDRWPEIAQWRADHLAGRVRRTAASQVTAPPDRRSGRSGSAEHSGVRQGRIVRSSVRRMVT
ncbi:hypothetical protein ALI22I_20390 [Saccharothrix sp. ALI-22-I]|uniref:hypothetical protein n=1 Tax=Saccharothrix sp. ALI-22-I TaxID=1933778 RepID=UPI00097BE71D|nr:hypothetical protein [Saccharothrix sp. ALI-22-I]ONI88100.1 hypothetical protein ALI22I_20390 [Saccharothrix sp. ALI-22-I]